MKEKLALIEQIDLLFPEGVVKSFDEIKREVINPINEKLKDGVWNEPNMAPAVKKDFESFKRKVTPLIDFVLCCQSILLQYSYFYKRLEEIKVALIPLIESGQLPLDLYVQFQDLQDELLKKFPECEFDGKD